MITVTDESGNKYTVDPKNLTKKQDEWYKRLPQGTLVQYTNDMGTIFVGYASKEGVHYQNQTGVHYCRWDQVSNIRPVPPPDNYGWARENGHHYQIRWLSGTVDFYNDDPEAKIGFHRLDGDTVIYVGPIPEEGE